MIEASQKMVAVEIPVVKVKKKSEAASGDERVEDKKVKKEKKKRKNEKLEGEEECIGEAQKEKKKKNKGENIVKVEGSSDCNGNIKKQAKEKKKKAATNDANDASSHHDRENETDSEIGKKKKNGKQIADDDFIKVEEVDVGEISQCTIKEGQMENEEKKQRKKKFMPEKESGPAEGNINVDGGEKEGREGKVEVKTSKKAKKGQANDFTLAVETGQQSHKRRKKTTDPEEGEDGVMVAKKKAKKTLDQNAESLGASEGETGVVIEEMVKKKTKKVKTKLQAATKEEAKKAETLEVQQKTKKKKAHFTSAEDDSEAKVKEEVEEKEIKKKRKKSKNKKGIKNKGGKDSEEEEPSGVEGREPKWKKMKKIREEDQLLSHETEAKKVGLGTETSVITASNTKSKKKKAKRSFSEVEKEVEEDEDTQETSRVMTKKIKKLEQVSYKEQEAQGAAPQVDAVFRSEKIGNTDMPISQERRLAVQTETDKASHPQVPAKLGGFGQWGTAQFDSSEKQQKFLRLMGGFKKGFQSTGASSGPANMALNKEGQHSLQQGLLGEFERAQSRRMDYSSKGAGLGFAAPSNKKFSIDIDACRSVRFDT
ncbi:lysine-rich nucleolar protein 1 [Lampris incognitus]|uniref:lysine-rich nucleolar protein 1 n=1 Tax=Lampris incognitus TaxID=2546036 RepID=UPI0024B63324|nr:lysine-rich nucleolar protein 1 [Lampris incognitus]